jgi:hypothetical protein
MITSITSFALPSGINLEEFRSSLLVVAPKFQGAAGLQSKFFLISEDGSRGGGVYLWNSKKDALAFAPIIKSLVQQNLGVEAEISYFETPAVVDNLAKQIRSA